MFNRISSITLAILMFLLLLGSQSNLYLLASAVVILIFASLAVNFKRLNFTWPHLLLPVLYLSGIGMVYAFIPTGTERLVFLISSSVLFYFLEMKLGREGHLLQNIFLLSVFAWYLAFFAALQHFHFSAGFMVIAVFIASYIFAVQGYAGFSLPAKRYFYLVLALITAEAAWGLSFWPTYFYVDAVVLFFVFYLIWLFSFSAFFGKLTREKIYWQLILVAVILLITLLTTPWRLIK